MSKHLAFDLGASSGRAIVGWIENGKLQLQEVHRFPNHPYEKDGRFYWNFTALSNVLCSFAALAVTFTRLSGGMTQGAGEEINVRLYADPDVEFQTVIDMLDKLQINHLNKVDVRMRDYRESRFYIPGSSD